MFMFAIDVSSFYQILQCFADLFESVVPIIRIYILHELQDSYSGLSIQKFNYAIDVIC